MPNVRDDEFETLDFAEEGEAIDNDERYEVAEIIAEFYSSGAVNTANMELAAQIIKHIRGN